MQPNSNLIPPDLAVNVGGPQLRMLRTDPPKAIRISATGSHIDHLRLRSPSSFDFRIPNCQPSRLSKTCHFIQLLLATLQ